MFAALAAGGRDPRRKARKTRCVSGSPRRRKPGSTCVTDGEQRRRHYIWGFFEGLDGIDTVNLGKRVQRGRRYHKEISAARMVGEPEWRGPIFVDAHARHAAR